MAQTRRTYTVFTGRNGTILIGWGNQVGNLDPTTLGATATPEEAGQDLAALLADHAAGTAPADGGA